MKRPVLAVAALVLSAHTASACHRYTVWRYPWKQACAATAAGRPQAAAPKPASLVPAAPKTVQTPSLPEPDPLRAKGLELLKREMQELQTPAIPAAPITEKGFS